MKYALTKIGKTIDGVVGIFGSMSKKAGNIIFSIPNIDGRNIQ